MRIAASRGRSTTGWMSAAPGWNCAGDDHQSAQIGARITEIPIILWPDKRAALRIAEFRDGCEVCGLCCSTRRTGFFFCGRLACCDGPCDRVLAAAWAAAITPRITLDIHTMISAYLHADGAQIFRSARSQKFQLCGALRSRTVSLKRVCGASRWSPVCCSVAFVSCSLAGCAWVTCAGDQRFRSALEVRQILFWSMWLFLGVQVIFASFF